MPFNANETVRSKHNSLCTYINTIHLLIHKCIYLHISHLIKYFMSKTIFVKNQIHMPNM